MKKWCIIMFGIVAGCMHAQQLPQYSQYMLNEMAINPAVAGTREYADARSNNRLQWVGITDAPRTYMLTLHGPIKDKNMGVGMNLYTDIVGPTRRTGLSLAYAYQLRLNKEVKLSMGLSAGLMQWGIDGNKITLREDGDTQLYTSYQTAIVPDIGTGLYLYKDNVYSFGISIPQLHEAPLKLYPGVYKNSRLTSQLNVNGMYNFIIDDNFSVEPSFLLKYEKPAPVKVDVGVRGIYKEMVWLGVVYRHHDAVSALLGYVFDNYLMVGYSYDFTTTKLQHYSGGTHELMLGIRFSKKQASQWKKANP